MKHFYPIAVLVLALLINSDAAAGNGNRAVAAMPTVVVSSERLDEYISSHPQLVTVLERQAIEAGNFLDLGEAINSMPGVEVRQAEGSMQTRISIQGSSGTGNILVLVNGRPLNTSQYGGVELAGLAIDTVKQVTVFKPPIPVWLGQGGPAGAINIETNDGKAASHPVRKEQIKLHAGSYGAASANLTSTTQGKDGRFFVSGGCNHRDGKRPNSDKDSLHLSLHWDKTKPSGTSLQVDCRTYFSEHGVAGPTYNPTPEARQRYAKGGLDFQVKGLNGDTGDFSVKSYLDTSSLKDFLEDGTSSSLKNMKGGVKAEQLWVAEEENGDLRMGILAEHNRVEHTLSGNHDREQVSLHAQLDKEFDKIAVSAGLRGDYVSDFAFFPAGTLGLSRSLDRAYLLKINAGYSVKVPSFGQLYQPSHGSMNHVQGNPNLREEKIRSYSLSLERRLTNKQMLAATLFRSDQRDIILYQRGDDLISRPQNVGRSCRQGLELSCKFCFGPIGLDTNYLIQQSEISATGRELSYTPKHKATLTVKYTMPFCDTRWEATFTGMSSQFSDPENDPAEKINGRGTVDLKIIQPLQFARQKAEIFFTINNLTDTDFESHYGYPDDGLRARVGLNMKF
jgi:iron complex outermembrane receptor protein